MVLSNLIDMDFRFIDCADISEELKMKLSDLAIYDEVAFLRLCRNYSNGDTAGLKKCNDIVRLAAALKASEFTFERYSDKGISESVFYDTMSDIGIWCRANENKGLKNYNWIKNHVSFELFKLGRLQFQIYKCKNASLNYAKLPFKFGDYVIYVHIPACGKLDIDECKTSLQKAVRFFNQYFPELRWEYFFCESWLLYDKNSEFMDNNSNIIKFSQLFDLSYSVYLENQTFERVFGMNKPVIFKSQIKLLPENTSLQKSAKEYKLHKGHFGIGIGTIKKQAVIPPDKT